MSLDAGDCRHCHRLIAWATTRSGDRVQIDVDPAPAEYLTPTVRAFVFTRSGTAIPAQEAPGRTPDQVYLKHRCAEGEAERELAYGPQTIGAALVGWQASLPRPARVRVAQARGGVA